MNALRRLTYSASTAVYYAVIFAWYFAVGAWEVLVIGRHQEDAE